MSHLVHKSQMEIMEPTEEKAHKIHLFRFCDHQPTASPIPPTHQPPDPGVQWKLVIETRWLKTLAQNYAALLSIPQNSSGVLPLHHVYNIFFILALLPQSINC
mmetsp:Transcript_56201/g.100062  ORF Transcript_56201/g.100062 Transcript_56201/m.100062 type:complete len:103 (-) Transcript_56201:983-1291(-)